MVVLLAGPSVAQTVVTTGRPVFPLRGLDVFDFDWEMPGWLVERQARWIPTWARVPHRPTGEVETMGAGEWLPLWWEHLPGSAKAALAALLVLIPLRAALLLASRRGRTGGGALRSAPAGREQAGGGALPTRGGGTRRGGATTESPARLLLEAALLAGLVFWFVLAPDPRFGWGFLLPLVVLLAEGVARGLGRGVRGAEAPRRALGRTAALPAAALLAVFLVQAWQVWAREPRTLAAAADHLVIPADYPRPSGVRQAVLGGGLRVWVPFPNDRCWYHPFPCTPMPDPRLEPRGRTLADGFRLRAAAPPPTWRPAAR